MTRFNFIAAPHPSIAERLRELEISPSTRTAAIALGIVLATCIGAAATEAARLPVARQQREHAAARALAADDRMSAARQDAADLRHRYALAATIATIHASGASRAALIAEIGDRLPATVWIKTIARDETGVTVSGEAKDYDALADALAALDRARTVWSPELKEALRKGDGTDGTLIAYALTMHERRK